MSWDDFPDEAPDIDTAPARASGDGVLALAAAFSGDVGRTALAHLRKITIDRAVAPDESDATLRFIEGQRALVRYIQTVVNQAAKGS